MRWAGSGRTGGDDRAPGGARRLILLAGAATGGAAASTAWSRRGRSGEPAASRRAGDIDVSIPPQAAYGLHFYPATMTLQEYADALFTDGLVIVREVSAGLPDAPTNREHLRARATFMTQYNARLSHTEVGSNGVNTALVYGDDDHAASGYANVNNVFALVSNSGAAPGDPDGDPAKNEIGGVIAAMRMGKEGEATPPRATFWGVSYTLRGGLRGQQPGALAAYTAVIQNHFDGPGSRFDHYGYAAVTWPGIGDGDDFWTPHGEGDRYADTHAIPFGFIVAGQSGSWAGNAGEIGFTVGVQSGGWATSWRGDRGTGFEDHRSKIGTGFRSIDWVENGLHVGVAHPDADAGAGSVAIDARDDQPDRPLLVRRVLSPTEELVGEEAVILSDGRIKAPVLADADDAVSTLTLPTAFANAVGTISDAVADQARATASLASVAAGVPTVVPGLSFSGAAPAGRYAIEDITADVGRGSATTVDASVAVALPGEYEVTVWADWDADATGTFRSLAVMTEEEGGGRVTTLASSYLPEGLVRLGLHRHDAYQACVRVWAGETGRPLFVVIAHDAATPLDVDLRMVVRPVLVDDSSLTRRAAHPPAR